MTSPSFYSCIITKLHRISKPKVIANSAKILAVTNCYVAQRLYLEFYLLFRLVKHFLVCFCVFIQFDWHQWRDAQQTNDPLCFARILIYCLTLIGA